MTGEVRPAAVRLPAMTGPSVLGSVAETASKTAWTRSPCGRNEDCRNTKTSVAGSTVEVAAAPCIEAVKSAVTQAVFVVKFDRQLMMVLSCKGV